VDHFGIEQEIELAAKPRRVARDGAQEGRIEAGADHGGLLGEGPRLAWQSIQSGEQDALDVERYFSRDVVGGRMPAGAFADQRAVLDQATDDLLEKERVAARAFDDPPLQLLREWRAAEQSSDQRIAR